MKKLLKGFADKRGLSAVEYILVGVVILTVVTTVFTGVSNALKSKGDTLIQRIAN